MVNKAAEILANALTIVLNGDEELRKIVWLRLKNKYFFLSLVILIIVLSVTWFVESNYAEILFMDYDAPDFAGQEKSELMKIMLESILTWEVYIDSAMRYVMHIFPLFAVVPAISYLFERKSYFEIGANRFRNRTKELMQAIFVYSLQGGLTISLAFLLFFTVGNFFLTPSISDIGGYAAIFPENFYFQHPFLFFAFMAVTIYFAIGFLFAMMACGIALITDKEYLVVALPVIVYIILSYIGGGFNIYLLQISSCVGAFNTLHPTLECFLPLSVILVIDILLLIVGVKKRNEIIS